MRKVILSVVLLTFAFCHVAAYGEAPKKNFKIAVGVEAKIQDVQLKQVKGFVVTPEGEKLADSTSFT